MAVPSTHAGALGLALTIGRYNVGRRAGVRLSAEVPETSGGKSQNWEIGNAVQLDSSNLLI